MNFNLRKAPLSFSLSCAAFRGSSRASQSFHRGRQVFEHFPVSNKVGANPFRTFVAFNRVFGAGFFFKGAPFLLPFLYASAVLFRVLLFASSGAVPYFVRQTYKRPLGAGARDVIIVRVDGLRDRLHVIQ